MIIFISFSPEMFYYYEVSNNIFQINFIVCDKKEETNSDIHKAWFGKTFS